MDSLVDILRLIRTKNVGNITFFELISYFGSARKALEALPSFVGSSLKKKFELCSKEQVNKEIEACNKLDITIITYQDYVYPTLLHHTDGKPPVLFAKGNLNLLAGLPIAVVGSRKASLNGAAVTTKLVKQLTEMNVVIISGMALGIDSYAHKASLDTGTIAVLGSGINVIFPPQNKDLYNEIIKNGLVLSSFPVNSDPIASNFPKRNYYIAGMSLGTLVIEAKLNSGSLITAYSAMQLGREVFAVPGNPNDPNSQGCNKLIKEGAILVESINDMIDVINKWLNDMEQLRETESIITKDSLKNLDNNQFKEMETIKQKILPMLSYTPVNIDLIKQEFYSDSNIIPLIILELELLGIIERIPGNKVKLTNKQFEFN